MKKLTKRRIKELEQAELEMYREHPANDLFMMYPGTDEFNILSLLCELKKHVFRMGYEAALEDLKMNCNNTLKCMKEVG